MTILNAVNVPRLMVVLVTAAALCSCGITAESRDPVPVKVEKRMVDDVLYEVLKEYRLFLSTGQQPNRFRFPHQN